MTITQSWYHLRIPSLLFVLLLLGCGSKGVRLDGLVPGTGNGVASLTTGDGGTCNTSSPCTSGTPADWNDSFITPDSSNSFTVAIKSAKLIKQGDPSPSYTIFDSGDIAKPVIQSFSPGATQTFGTNTDFPADGTYDRIQYVVSYYEMVIPILYPGRTVLNANRRVRLYLGSIPNDPIFGQVFQNDILIDDNGLQPSLKWIDPTAGLGNFFFPRPSGSSSALQVPTSQLPLNGLLFTYDVGTDTPTPGVTLTPPPPYLIAQVDTALTASTTLTINFANQDGASSSTTLSLSSSTPVNTNILVPLGPGNTRIESISTVAESPDITDAVTVQFFGGGGVDTPSTDPYTFTLPLNTPLPVSGSPDNQFVIQLTFDTTKIFFFDSTFRDSSGDIPTNNINFKPPLATCITANGYTNAPCDGRLDANPKANFWPGLPAVTAEQK